ncbi:MAG TPA: VOC family protein [Acidimicrobiia bacterium]|jgi:PhnB protein
MHFHPYLTFGGTCADAFAFYQEIFGGPLEVMTMAEAPGGSPDGAEPDAVMHASLTTDGGALLMGADHPTGDFTGPVHGMCVTAELPTKEEAHRVFDELSEGGTVQMPMAETFFSHAFGMCLDRFGTPWMVMAGTMPGS